MKTANIQIIAGAVDDLPVSTDPMYQPAVLALMIRKNLEELNAQGFQFKAAESSDLTTFNSDMSTYLSNANTRFDEWLQGQTASVAATLPDALAVGDAMLSGGAGAVGSLILQRVLGMAFHREDSRAEHEGAHANVNLSAIETELANIENQLNQIDQTLAEDVVDQIAGILTEFGVNIYSDPENSQWTVGPMQVP